MQHRITVKTAAQRDELAKDLDYIRRKIAFVRSNLDPKIGGYGTIEDTESLGVVLAALNAILSGTDRAPIPTSTPEPIDFAAIEDPAYANECEGCS